MTVSDEIEKAARARPDVKPLTGLRIVAALWVVLFHWSFTPGPEYQGTKDALYPLLHYGYLGVDIFYVLSGYVITLTYIDVLGKNIQWSKIGHYMWARICRIWPAYMLVTVLFGIWLLSERARVGPGRDITFQTRQPDLGWWSWIEQTLMIQQWTDPWSDGVSFVGPTWSVSAEILAYLLFPISALVLFRMRNLPWWVLAAGSVLVMLPMALHAARTGQPYFPYSWMARLFTGFTAGALACLAARKIPITPRVSRVAATVTFLALGQLAIILMWSAERTGDRSALATILFPVIVGSLALSTHGIARLLSTKGALLGGRLSYSLYLVHVPVLEIFWIQQFQHDKIAPGGPYTYLIIPNLILLSVILGYLLWRYVEEPARKRMRFALEHRTWPDPPSRTIEGVPEEPPHHHRTRTWPRPESGPRGTPRP